MYLTMTFRLRKEEKEGEPHMKRATPKKKEGGGTYFF